jgi:hypothetical protein
MGNKARQYFWLAGTLQSASFEIMKVRDELEGSKPAREVLGRLKAIIEQLDTIQGMWVNPNLIEK